MKELNPLTWVWSFLVGLSSRKASGELGLSLVYEKGNCFINQPETEPTFLIITRHFHWITVNMFLRYPTDWQTKTNILWVKHQIDKDKYVILQFCIRLFTMPQILHIKWTLKSNWKSNDQCTVTLREDIYFMAPWGRRDVKRLVNGNTFSDRGASHSSGHQKD